MALADYAHWHEEALYMWWQEEGRFSALDFDDPYDDQDYDFDPESD